MSWSFPLAWAFLGLAPLIWWWHGQRQAAPPVLLGSIELWKNYQSGEQALVHRATRRWDAALWMKLLILVLLTFAAAGPQCSVWPEKASTEIELQSVAFSTSAYAPDKIDWIAQLKIPVAEAEKENGTGAKGRLVLRSGNSVVDARTWSGEDSANEIWLNGTILRPQSERVVLSLERADRSIVQTVELRVPATPKNQVLLLSTKPQWFMKQAILALPGWEVKRMNETEVINVLSKSSENGSHTVVMVFDPLSPEKSEQVLARAPAWFWASGPGGQGEALPMPVISQQVSQHPVLQGLDLSLITFIKTSAVVTNAILDENIIELILTPEGPLLLAGERTMAQESDPWRQERMLGEVNPQPTVRWLASAFLLEDSDLALRAEFPALIQQGLAWLSQQERFSQTTSWSQADFEVKPRFQQRLFSGGWLSEIPILLVLIIFLFGISLPLRMVKY